MQHWLPKAFQTHKQNSGYENAQIHMDSIMQMSVWIQMDKELNYAYKMHFRDLANNLVLFAVLPKYSLSYSPSQR